ncbi:anthranilate synthase component I, partial [Acidimicrobiaceae bacterium USS-CC1]|nr:anthranilate synthase component I [Acidiferrimicrobium australe]
PKVRAMQIIDELEPVKRGPYAGPLSCVDGGMPGAAAGRGRRVLPPAGRGRALTS